MDVCSPGSLVSVLSVLVSFPNVKDGTFAVQECLKVSALILDGAALVLRDTALEGSLEVGVQVGLCVSLW